MSALEGKPVFIRYADSKLYNEAGEQIGSARPSPGKLGVVVWDLKNATSGKGLFYGEFESLNSAVETIGNIYGEFNTIYHCFNERGRLIWEKRCEDARDLPDIMRAEDLDEEEIFRKKSMASHGMIRVFSYAVSTGLSGAGAKEYRGDFLSLKDVVEQLDDALGGDGFVTVFSCYDEQGTCLFSQLDGYTLRDLLDSDKLTKGGTASELRRVKN
jgi:hypothetical protein